MTTDDEFIQQLRSSLHKAVADAEPPPDLRARVAADLTRGGRRVRRRGPARLWPGVRHPWQRVSLQAIPMVLTIGTTLAVVVAALVLLGRQPASHPAGGTPTPITPVPLGSPNDPAAQYAVRAIDQANRNHACAAPPSVTRRRNRPKIGQSVPQELSSILAALRRPTSGRDRMPSLVDDSLVQSDARVIYPSGMRLALTAAGSRYYLLPILTTPGAGVSPLCAAARQAALRRDRPHIPLPLRAPAERDLAAITARQRYDSGAHPAACELVVAPQGRSASCLASVQQITQAGTLDTFGFGTVRIASGIVPDGVASITLQFSTTKGRSQTITTRPTSNMFAVEMPKPASEAAAQTILWRNKAGDIIKTISAAQAESV